MRSLFVIIILLFTLLESFSQRSNVVVNTDSLNTNCKRPEVNTRYEDDNDGSLFYLFQRSWHANEDISYASVLPQIRSIGNRRIPLLEQEGQSTTRQVFDAKIANRFPIMQGRVGHSEALRAQRLTFDYIVDFRMNQDASKPVNPRGNQVGFGYDVTFWNNHMGAIKNYSKYDKCLTHETAHSQHGKIVAQENSRRKRYKFLTFSSKLYHYSNGQPKGNFFVRNEKYDSLFAAGTDSLELIRNNYRSGDFSTNFIKFELTRGAYTKANNALHLTTIGYRRELGDSTGLFKFSPEQLNRYGKNRVFAKYDYRSGPRKNPFFNRKAWHQPKNSCNDEWEYFQYEKQWEYHLRVEGEYILDELSDFRPNLEGQDGKYKFSVKALFEIAPLSHRTIGYFVSGYFGRDYLNIRFDDIIYSVQAGVTFNFNKYKAPFWKSGASFVSCCEDCVRPVWKDFTEIE